MIKISLKYSIIFSAILALIFVIGYQTYNLYLGGQYPQKIILKTNGKLLIEATKKNTYGISKRFNRLCDYKEKYIKTNIPYFNIEHVQNTNIYNIFFHKNNFNKKIQMRFLSKESNNICVWTDTEEIVTFLTSRSYFSIKGMNLNIKEGEINLNLFRLQSKGTLRVLPLLNGDYLFEVQSKEELTKNILFYQGIEIANLSFNTIKR